jgi:tripartite-type tricarboxylate transporter receptor subunit TctC
LFSYSRACVRHLGLAVLIALAGLGPVNAGAQAWPNKIITLVVPFPPGGGVDLFARITAEKLAPKLGKPLVIENKPGVGGLAGANTVYRAAPDGSTFLVAPNTIFAAPFLMASGATGGVKVMELTPVILPAQTPMMLVVNPALGAKSVDDLVKLAKAKPGMNYGSAGNGSPMQFAGELFKKSAGIDLTHVPYKGVAASVTATVSNEVSILFVSLGGGVAGLLESGTLVPLAMTQKKRTELLPKVPTMGELGYKSVEADAWYGVFAPPGTPAAVVEQMNAEINSMLKLPDVKARLNTVGIDVAGGTPQDLAAEMREESARDERVIREFDIKFD